MSISAWVSVSDLVTVKKTFLEKIIHDLLKGEKSKMFATQPLNDIFPALKNAGVNGLELLVQINTSNENIEEVKQIVKKYQLPVLSIHQSLDSYSNISSREIERLCKIANLFSAKIIVLHSNALRRRLFDEMFILTLKKLQKKHSVIFGIENMPKSPFSLNSDYTWKEKEFTSVCNKAGLSVTFDTTHLAQAGYDICKFYMVNKEKIVDIHLSDFKKHWLNSKLLLQNGTHLALEEGELPIAKFLRLLKETNYSGLITMEINSNLKGLCKSAQIIKNT